MRTSQISPPDLSPEGIEKLLKVGAKTFPLTLQLIKDLKSKGVLPNDTHVASLLKVLKASLGWSQTVVDSLGVNKLQINQLKGQVNQYRALSKPYNSADIPSLPQQTQMALKQLSAYLPPHLEVIPPEQRKARNLIDDQLFATNEQRIAADITARKRLLEESIPTAPENVSQRLKIELAQLKLLPLQKKVRAALLPKLSTVRSKITSDLNRNIDAAQLRKHSNKLFIDAVLSHSKKFHVLSH